MFSSLFSFRGSPGRRGKRPASSRPWLELLEDRTVPSAVPPPPGMVSWWPGDGNAADIIGNNPGTLAGDTSFAPGEVGQAFQFDGVEDMVAIGGSYNITGPRTLEAWVFPQANTGFGLPIFTAGTPGHGDFFGIAGTTGTAAVGQYKLYVDHWGFTAYDSNITVQPNAWNHVALTYDGSTVRFYVDGVAGSAVPGTLYNYNLNTADIGGNVIGGTTTKASFNGLIDEVSFYNRALSAAEIQAIYQAGPAGKIKPARLGPFVVAGFPSSIQAGVPGTFTVTATNTDGTIDTGYTGTVHFASSDPQAVLPADYTFTAADQGSHTFQATLVSAGLQSLTVADVAAPAISGTQAGIVVNPVPLAPDEQYLRALYLYALSRPGSPAEWNGWEPLLQQPNGPFRVAYLVEHSFEARDRLVQSWYATYLGRQPVGGEELGWVRFFFLGATEEQVLAGLLSSPEYFLRSAALAGSLAGPSAVTFVEALYTGLLQRPASAAEVTFWAGQVQARGLSAVAQALVSSAEYRTLVVRMDYLLLLGRQPSTTELAGWVYSPFDLTAIRAGLEGSLEFYLRMIGFAA